MNDAYEPEDLCQAIAEQRALASGLFDTMYERSRDVEGVTRAGWSDAEEAGIRLIADKATDLGLEVEFDELGQVYATLPGRDRSLPRVAIGSHFDSVRRGGNYDGYAGVVAGMTVLAAFRARGIAPGADVTVLGMRGEESVWYGIAYIGSRYVVGDLGWEELSALTRIDTGERLTAHLQELGYDAAAVRESAGRARLTSANTRAYLELHIEQGGFLDDTGIALAVPTAIRGNARFPEVTCVVFRSDVAVDSRSIPRRLVQIFPRSSGFIVVPCLRLVIFFPGSFRLDCLCRCRFPVETGSGMCFDCVL